jgi:hypothetical protein
MLQLRINGVYTPTMSHEFNKNDTPPQTRPFSGRSGGPPHKHTAVGVLDPPENDDNSSSPPRPWSLRSIALFILAIVAVMLLVGFFLNR